MTIALISISVPGETVFCRNATRVAGDVILVVRLFVFDLARLTEKVPDDSFRFYAREVISWGGRLDNG